MTDVWSLLTLPKKILRATAWAGLRALVQADAYRALLPIYERAIRQIDSNGRLREPARGRRDGELTVLALSAEQYRKDPQVLAGVAGIRVLVLPQRWQTRLLLQFVEPGHPWVDYMNPPPGSALERQKARYRRFLRGFLPLLYERHGVDCVIGPHVHYYPDADIGAVSQTLGLPFVVLHRENMVLSSFLCEMVWHRLRLLKPFEGSQIIVHNEAMREVMIGGGFVDEKRVSALGCVRMDEFVRSCARAEPPRNARKRILFFPFYTGWTFPEPVRPFFNAAHATLVRYAMLRPDVDVHIKPKAKFEAAWRKDFDRALNESGLRIDALANLRIDCSGDAQELILKADVVSGLQTTTLLEAGLAGRPVVIPYFKEIDVEEYNARVMFRDSFDCFDVAHDPDEFIAMLDRALAHPMLEPNKREGVRRVFSRFVSDLEGQATSRYAAAIRAAVAGVAGHRGPQQSAP